MISKHLKLNKLSLDDLPMMVAISSAYPELNWNEAKLKETLARSDVLGLGLWDGINLLSFILISFVFNEAEILILATASISRNQGYASQLLQALQVELRSKSINQVFLEVRASNATAIKVYQNFGFKIINTRKAYYANPHGAKEDAIVMELSF